MELSSEHLFDTPNPITTRVLGSCSLGQEVKKSCEELGKEEGTKLTSWGPILVGRSLQTPCTPYSSEPSVKWDPVAGFGTRGTASSKHCILTQTGLPTTILWPSLLAAFYTGSGLTLLTGCLITKWNGTNVDFKFIINNIMTSISTRPYQEERLPQHRPQIPKPHRPGLRFRFCHF